MVLRPDLKLKKPIRFRRKKILAGALSCAIILLSCERVGNNFIVHSPSGDVMSAELQLCRKSQPLIQHGNSFKGQMAISCEGSGKIVVRLKDGTETRCPVGYVTPGMESTFEYVIKDGACS